MKPKIFISHIHEEKELALFLQERIKKHFLNLADIFVSSDSSSIRPGEDWQEKLEKALSEARVIIVLCSKASVSRSWISFETAAGILKRIPVIPVCHSGLGRQNLPAPFSRYEAIEANNEAGMSKLYELIAHLLGSAKPPVKFNKIVERIKEIESNYMKPAPGSAGYLPADLFELLKGMRHKPFEQEFIVQDGVIWSDDKARTRWSSDNRHIINWIEERIRELSSAPGERTTGWNKRLRVICYSFISYYNRYEAILREFLENGGELRILISAYDSKGFYEKTALESIRDLSEKDTSIKAWEQKTLYTRVNHKNDIVNSIDRLWDLRELYGEGVDFRFHSDTPNINGIIYGDKAMHLISYFLNPISRGIDLPTLLIGDVNAHTNLQLLYKMVSNWFDVKFANGVRPDRSKSE